MTMINIFMKIVLKFLSIAGSVFAFFYSIKNCLEKRKLYPKITNDLLLLPACELTKKIRCRKVTCEEVITAYIKRVKEVNPVLNAVVEDRFNLAIQEAQKYDVMLTQTKYNNSELMEKYPLLGVPITIKESIGVKGMSHSVGQVHLKNFKADRDAEVVTLIKEAGGIILLVSNTPELCCNTDTSNYVTGITRNPYDTRKTPSGSSGGEAALLGSGASLIGIGSDMLGSVRLPASFCGVWGHKPSVSIVSIDNHGPICNDKGIEKILSIGPLTRYQVDLPLILDVMLKQNARFLVKLNETTPLHAIKIYYAENYPKTSKVEPEISQAINKVLRHLQSECKCKVKKISVEKNCFGTIQFFKYLSSIRNFPGLFENHPTGYWLEALYYLVGKSDLSFNHILMGLLQKIFLVVPKSVNEDCQNEIDQLKDEYTRLLGNDGVLILPTHPTAATFNGQFYKKLFDFGFTSIFNLIGFPATQCPVGFNSKMLPIGIQVAAVTNNDKLCLKVAEEINKIYGGWIPPSFSD